MAEYLSKEEIKQWRSSLEKITLEDFAARLGKIVPESKATNDMADTVFDNKKVSLSRPLTNDTQGKLAKIAERAFERERQLSHTPFSFRSPVEEESEAEIKNEESPVLHEVVDVRPDEPKKDSLREEVDIVLKKNLTDREQVVFDYLLEHKNTTVYAKDIALLLNLPRDYVYKYIKNLRSKIDGDRLRNSDKGGFILSV